MDNLNSDFATIFRYSLHTPLCVPILTSEARDYCALLNNYKRGSASNRYRHLEIYCTFPASKPDLAYLHINNFPVTHYDITQKILQTIRTAKITGDEEPRNDPY